MYVCLHDMYECIGGHLLYVGLLNKACILYLDVIHIFHICFLLSILLVWVIKPAFIKIIMLTG